MSDLTWRTARSWQRALFVAAVLAVSVVLILLAASQFTPPS
jgi:hypothetical protein